MSSTSATARVPARASARPAVHPSTPGPRLRVVAAPAEARSRAGLAILCLAILATGLIALLLLNISLNRGSFVLHDLQTQQTRLQEQEQTLREQLENMQAPQVLSDQARKLGMVPASRAAFLRAADGHVLGAPAPARASSSPSVTHTP